MLEGISITVLVLFFFAIFTLLLMKINVCKGGITMETLRMALILFFTFCGGMVMAQIHGKFSLEEQYDEDDEKENDKELKEREES